MLRHMLSSETCRKSAFPQGRGFLDSYCTLSQPAQCKHPVSGQQIQRNARIPSLPASQFPWGEDHGNRPSPTSIHCCCSEEAHIQCQRHEITMLFNGERNNCSQCSSRSPCRQRASSSSLRLWFCPDPRDGTVLAREEMFRRCPQNLKAKGSETGVLNSLPSAFEIKVSLQVEC